MRGRMNRLAALITLFGLAAAPQERRTESFWRRILRIAGISATPGSMKAPLDLATGEVWTIRLGRGTLSQLTAEGGYRSPVFLPGGDAVLALRGAELIRIPLGDAAPSPLFA